MVVWDVGGRCSNGMNERVINSPNQIRDLINDNLLQCPSIKQLCLCTMTPLAIVISYQVGLTK
jgi:hypothetical protein